MAKDVTEIATMDKLRDYELVYIIKPDAADEKLESTIELVGKFITDKGGTVGEVQRWGKKKLAYPIKHFLEGNYILTRCRLDPSISKELETRLKITDDILRYLFIRVDE